MSAPNILLRVYVMEKLTKFVSTSFENNNNNTTKIGDECLQSKFETNSFSLQPIKTEKEILNQDESKKPKNWLISDIEDSDNSAAVGIDLRLNPPRVLSKVKCNDKSDIHSDENAFSKKHKWCESNVFVKSSTQNPASPEPHNMKTCLDVFDKSSNDQENTCEEHEDKMCKFEKMPF